MKKSPLIAVLTIFVSFTLFAQNGLKAEYYDGVSLRKLVGTQIENNIDYYWDRHAPFPDMDPGECSVRWTGRLLSPETGDISFLARVDDGIRVWIDGRLIIDNWQLNDVGYSRGTVKMQKGAYYDLKVEYFNALREAEIRLYWVMPEPEDMSWYESFWYEEKPEIVPASHCFLPIREEIPELEQEETQEKEVLEPAISVPKKKPVVKPKSKSISKTVIENYIPENVEFEQAKAEILPESFSELDRLAHYLIDNPQYKISIEGHTDNVGDAQKNVELSQSRARAVAAYLIKKGVGHERLSAEGFGGSQPLIKSADGKYNPANRRVEFIVE